MQKFDVAIIDQRNNDGQCEMLLQLADGRRIGIYNCLMHPIAEYVHPGVGYMGDVYDALGNTQKGILYMPLKDKWILEVQTDKDLHYN